MIRKFFLILILFLTIRNVSASEKMPYSHMAAIGADKSFGNEYNGPASPVIFYSYYRSENGIFSKFQTTTTSIFYRMGYEEKNYIFAVAPMLNHSVNGAYADYNQGINNKKNTYMGSNGGLEFYYKYIIGLNDWSEFFSTKISYFPSWKFFYKNDDTKIEIPENYYEQSGALEIKFDAVKSESLNRIKHGILLSSKYVNMYRNLPGEFIDEKNNSISDFKITHKFYGILGLYYNFPGDVNLQIDAMGSYQENVDRNNGEQIGSYVADFATMPGYYFSEFIHDRFLISKFQLGIPLGFWQGRFAAGFNLLYMPEKNNVIGLDNYPHEIYRSVSCSASFFIGNKLPFFVDYAYGYDAERLSKKNDKVEKGSHEVRAFFFFAFGKLD